MNFIFILRSVLQVCTTFFASCLPKFHFFVLKAQKERERDCRIKKKKNVLRKYLPTKFQLCSVRVGDSKLGGKARGKTTYLATLWFATSIIWV